MATATSNSTVRRRGPDPTGRLDLCVIRLLEHAVSTHGDLPLRGIYGTYKPEIDRAIKRHLGKVRFYVPEPVQRILEAQRPQPAPPPPPPTAKPSTGPVFEMGRNANGVYEVKNA